METTRIQLELPAERVRELDEMVREAGLSTRKDLLNYALTLLEWALDENKTGRVIASLDQTNNRYKELVMPIFRSRGSKTDPQPADPQP